MSWKTLESPGSNQRHLSDRKIALYQLSQILNYKTDGSLVNFRRMTFQSTQKTTEDVDNGHSKECRSFDVDLHCYTFKIRFRAVYTMVYASLRRCMQTRSHPEHAAAKRGHHRLFLFGPGKRGVRPHPPNPPLLRARVTGCTRQHDARTRHQQRKALSSVDHFHQHRRKREAIWWG